MKHPALTRRRFLKSSAAALGALALPGTANALAAPARKPNVVIIYTDDQGSVDLGCCGSRDLVTPHADALAARGVRFTQMYAPSAVCSPSRAGLLTGRCPHRAGVPGNISSKRGDKGMPSEQVTIAETFRAAGYATAHVGKWHLGYSEDTMPNAQGFDVSFGHMGGCIDNYSHYFYWNGPNRHDLWRNGKEIHRDGRYFPDLMVDEATAFMESRQDKPFFLYFAINMPHYPYQPDVEWLERYRQAGVPYPRDLYGAFVSSQDERIGRLLDAVDRLGLRDDTIIVFQSDQGHSTEERAHHGGGSAGPYRGSKFSLFEGGIRIPSIISWPGRLPQNTVRDQVVHACDWLPTLAGLCGVPLLEEDIDGKDIAPVLKSDSAPSPHDTLRWQLGDQWAVRRGDWKLIVNGRVPGEKLPPEDRLFLANLAKDPTEQTNFARDYPDIVQRLETHKPQW